MNYVLGIIACSKDGIAENQISDFFQFLASDNLTESDSRKKFKCNYSTFHESISPFIAGSATGFIRFFHGSNFKYIIFFVI